MKRKKRGTGPQVLTGSTDAKRLAAVILEVLSGLRCAREGAEAMGVSPNRYYQLETRALQGLIVALERRPKGRQQSAEEKVAVLAREKRRLEQELGRLQALVRAAQRSMGIPAFPGRGKASKLGGKDKARVKKKKRRTPPRGLRAVTALRQGPAAADKPKTSPPGSSASASA
jgi:hypothetical protein